MTRIIALLASLLFALAPAAVEAQPFPQTLPDKTVVGRIGTGTGTGPWQAIPFSTLGTQLITAVPGIDANILNTQLTNYTVATTDCSHTIQLGTGSTGQFTLTFPSVSGFAGTCSLLVVNKDTTNGKIISGISGLEGSPQILYPGQAFGAKIVNGAWQAFYTPGRWILSTSTTLYVNGNGVSSATCGISGGSTCSAGSDANDCLTPATACLTTQHVVNEIIAGFDLAGTTINVNLAHGSSTNYAFTCETGTVLGQSVFGVTGDSSAPTAVTIIVPNGGNGAAVKDSCTVSISNLAFQDSAGANAAGFISVGLGGYGHVDFSGITFGACAACAALTANYSGSVTMVGNSSVTGSEPFFAFASGGGVIDLTGGVLTGSSSLTFTDFAVIQSLGIVIAASGNFAGFASITGPRCSIVGMASANAVNPNSVFPGSADCVADTAVGAIGVQKGSGGSSTLDYGSSGFCLLSGGGSGVINSWGACVGTGVPQNNLNSQTTNYTIATSDCGKTVSMSGGSFTVTLPSVSGFAANCVLAVQNASSTRGQKLSGFPGALSASPNNILWPTDSALVAIVNGAWTVQSYVQRHKLTGSITVFVDSGAPGVDSNDCLASGTSACLTIQGALNYIATWDTNGKAVNVSVADGAYNSTVLVNGPWHGNGVVTITGDTGTPANVTASTTTWLTVQNGAQLTLAGGFTITASATAILVQNQSTLNITGAMVYNDAATTLFASTQAAILVTANYTINKSTSGTGVHIQSTQGGYIDTRNLTVTITGTPAWTTAFVNAQVGGVVNAFGETFSGSATGKRYNATLGGNIRTNQTSDTYFPGNSAGTVSSGGMIDGPGIPTVSSCGTSPSAVTGTDFAGFVTEGTTATGCTVTFKSGSTMGACSVSLSTGAAVGISTLGATLVVTHASLSSNVLYWVCKPN